MLNSGPPICARAINKLSSAKCMDGADTPARAQRWDNFPCSTVNILYSLLNYTTYSSNSMY